MFKKIAVALLSLALIALPASAQTLGSQVQLPSGAQTLTQMLGNGFQSPWFSFSPNSLVVSWNSGQIYVGNGTVPIAPGSVTLTASKTTCARANIVAATDSCNYIYSNSSGTIAVATAIATAISGGNSLLALAVTSSTGVTSLQPPYSDTSGLASLFSGMFQLTVNNTPSATSASIQTVAQTFTYTGLASGDLVTLINQPAPTSLCPATSVRATGANTLSIYFTVLTAAACTPASGNYTILVIR